MYNINVLALVWFSVSLAIIFVGVIRTDERTISGGLFILVALIFASFCFHCGAGWQDIHIKENYVLIKKEKPF